VAEQEGENGQARHRQSDGLSGVRKAAILLVAVGEELAGEILRVLPEADIQQLTEELAELRGISPELSAEVLEDFWQLLETQGFVMHGGLDYASRLLMETFGARRRPRRATWPSCSAPTRSNWASCLTPSIRRPLRWYWPTWIPSGRRRCWTT